EGDRNHVAGIISIGEEDLERRDAVVHQLVDVEKFLIGFRQDFARGHVDYISGDVSALQIGSVDFHLVDLGLENRLVQRLGDLAALGNDGLVLGRDRFRQLQSDEAFRNLPEQLLVLDQQFADVVKRPQNLRIGLETERAQKHGAVEFPFAVDTDVKQLLVVVLE